MSIWNPKVMWYYTGIGEMLYMQVFWFEMAPSNLGENYLLFHVAYFQTLKLDLEWNKFKRY